MIDSLAEKRQYFPGRLDSAFDLASGGMGIHLHAVGLFAARKELPKWARESLTFYSANYLSTPYIYKWRGSQHFKIGPFALSPYSELNLKLFDAKDKEYSRIEMMQTRLLLGGEDALSVPNPESPITDEQEWASLLIKSSERGLIDYDAATAPQIPTPASFFDVVCNLSRAGIDIPDEFFAQHDALQFSERFRAATLEAAVHELAAMLAVTEQLTFDAQALGIPIPSDYRPTDSIDIWAANWQSMFGEPMPGLAGLYHQAQGLTHQLGLYDLMDWSYSGISMVKIGGVRPIDFVDERVSKRPKLLDAFRFLVEARFMFEDNKNYDQALADNQDGLFQRYPNKTKNTLAVAAAAITYLSDVPVEYFSVERKHLGSEARAEMVRLARNYISRALEVGKAASQVLTNPNSPEFLTLSQEIQGYMAQGRIAEMTVLNVLGVKNADQASNLYRKARELATIYPEHTAFYTDLSDAIRDFEIEMLEGTGLLTVDDVPTLLNEGEMTAPFSTVEDIGKAVARIHPSAYAQSFSLNTDALNWGVLVKPQSADIIFDKGRPRSFRIKFVYQSPEGESAILEGKYQLQKGNQKFELNFLEAQSEIPEMYQACLQATLSILDAVGVQVEEKRKTKAKESPALPSKPAAPTKKVPYIKEGATEVKTKVKTRPEQPVQPQEEEEVQQVVVFEPEKSKMVMDEVSKKRIQKQLEKVSHEDRANIQEAIDRFNNGGSIRFYPLKSSGPNGEVLFALRAKATVRGGSRILVTPIKGTSDFAVIAAGYRKDIYRDWGLE